VSYRNKKYGISAFTGKKNLCIYNVWKIFSTSSKFCHFLPIFSKNELFWKFRSYPNFFSFFVNFLKKMFRCQMRLNHFQKSPGRHENIYRKLTIRTFQFIWFIPHVTGILRGSAICVKKLAFSVQRFWYELNFPILRSAIIFNQF